MARPLRLEYPGAVYHVTSQGNAWQDIFADDADRAIQERLLAASRALVDFPRCANVKALANHACTHRLRTGDWRLLFNAFEEINIISIEEVKKRDDRTY